MLIDAPARAARTEYLKSDQIKTLDLPSDSTLPEIAKRLQGAMLSDRVPDVRDACAAFLAVSSDFYKFAPPVIRVLAARPLRVRENWTTELFGDYQPDTMLIRVWLRTAVRKEVTSFGTFLSTLCHEFCHHLDFQLFKFSNSWHTRGFYERSAALYHHARGTPRKRLFWAPVSGGRWRIDWQRTARAGKKVSALPVQDFPLSARAQAPPSELLIDPQLAPREDLNVQKSPSSWC